MEFADKVAIVTGAAEGIGRACAQELARGGASVAIVDIAGEDVMIRTSRLLKETGARIATFNADVTDHGKAQRIVAEVRARMGRVDILVNAAGMNADAPLWDMTESQWDRVMSVNLKGTFNYIYAVARQFREQQSGKIVNIAAIQAWRTPNAGNYAASKAGVISLTKSSAIELGRFNINVNAVAPGYIRTSELDRSTEKVRKERRRIAALNQPGEPQDVANVVAFLCSERARHITGEVIKVDGGQYL